MTGGTAIHARNITCRCPVKDMTWNLGFLSMMALISCYSNYYTRYSAIVTSFILVQISVILNYYYLYNKVFSMKTEARGSGLKNLSLWAMHIPAGIWAMFTVVTVYLFGAGTPGVLVLAVTIFGILNAAAMKVRSGFPARSLVIHLFLPTGIWCVISKREIGFFLLFLALVQGSFLIVKRHREIIRKNVNEASDSGKADLAQINRELENEILYRKNMERALRGSEERYRTLFQNNPIETIIVDHNGRITGYNSAKARSMGRIPEIGDIMYKDYGSRHKNDMFAELMDCITTGKQKEFPEQKYNERYLYVKISPYSHGAIITSLDITKIKKAEEQIKSLTREIMRVQENERKRIARDLHDSVAQDLSLLRISCETFFDDVQENSFKIRHKVKEISRVLHGAIHAVRDIAYELRPPSLDELGIAITLFRYCEDFKTRTGIHTDFFSAGLEQVLIDSETEINLYRLIQEALNNVRKHSHATHVNVRMVASYPYLILRIEDNGLGFDYEHHQSIGCREKHMGLRSMEERVHLLGGRIVFKTAPGSGTRIFVEIPALKMKDQPSTLRVSGE